MKMVLHGNGITLTTPMKELAHEKFLKLRRLISRLDHSDLLLTVELGRTTGNHQKGKIFRAEAHMPLGKQDMFAAVEGDDLYEAIDHCVHACKKQLLRIKETFLSK